MVLTDSEVGSLKATLNCWEWFGYISTAIVFTGCVGEFVAEFTSLPKTNEARSRLARLSLIVLILGIAGELLSTVRTSQLSGQLIANIEDRAGRAERNAGEANERASVNEREAAQLRLQVEQEKTARAKLEKYAAWRTISDEQADIIVKRLAPLKGRTITMFVYTTDPETSGFANRLAAVLNRVMKVGGASWPGKLIPKPGLRFSYGKDRKKDFDLIVSALDAAGIEKASVLRAAADEEKPDDGIELNIGGKH